MKWLTLITLMYLALTSAVSAKDYYPERALQDEVSGVAIIDCVLQADGKVKDCVVVKEMPRGYGFGEATVKLFEDEYNLNTQTPPHESHNPGDHMTFTYTWKLN